MHNENRSHLAKSIRIRHFVHAPSNAISPSKVPRTSQLPLAIRRWTTVFVKRRPLKKPRPTTGARCRQLETWCVKRTPDEAGENRRQRRHCRDGAENHRLTIPNTSLHRQRRISCMHSHRHHRISAHPYHRTSLATARGSARQSSRLRKRLVHRESEVNVKIPPATWALHGMSNRERRERCAVGQESVPLLRPTPKHKLKLKMDLGNARLAAFQTMPYSHAIAARIIALSIKSRIACSRTTKIRTTTISG